MERNWNAEDYARNSECQLKLGEELIGKLFIKGGEFVLDIGCGDGKISAKLSKPSAGKREIRRQRGPFRILVRILQVSYAMEKQNVSQNFERLSQHPRGEGAPRNLSSAVQSEAPDSNLVREEHRGCFEEFFRHICCAGCCRESHFRKFYPGDPALGPFFHL